MLSFNQDLIINYTNNSQKVRVMSENWTENNIYCPNCWYKIINLENNKKVSDFLCENCKENYEQKASKNKFKDKVLSSEYNTLIERLNSKNKPNLFFLYYLKKHLLVNDFFTVPKYFFIPEIIEKRKPLSLTAKRAGWTWSNILFSKIPNFWKIYYIEDWKVSSKEEVLKKWNKITFFKDIKQIKSKGWILDIMNIIESLWKKDFKLQEIYNFEVDLKFLHPENNNVKPKIRQQLQILRDKGYLEFVSGGKYRVL